MGRESRVGARAAVEPSVSAFDLIIQTADPPMIVVTAAADGRRAGCLVGFHSQASIDPVLYALWISKANYTSTVIDQSTHVAAHFLTEDEWDIAALFGQLTGDDVDKFTLCESDRGPGDVPLLRRCANKMVLRRMALFDAGGDHVCVIGEPVSVEAQSGRPLRFTAVERLEPGHQADEER